MRNVRRNVFESNSSSSHVVSITEYEAPSINNIPRNYDGIYMIEQLDPVGSSEERIIKKEHNTELSKLSFLVGIIAYLEKEKKEKEYAWDYKKRDIEGYNETYFNKMINSGVFKWLKEVVKEETGTEISFIRPCYNWYPFFECADSDDEYGYETLGLTKDNITEENFKNVVRNTIFNQNVRIIDSNVPYGMEE